MTALPVSVLAAARCRRLLPVLLSVVVAGCAAQGEKSGPAQPARPQKPKTLQERLDGFQANWRASMRNVRETACVEAEGRGSGAKATASAAAPIGNQ